MILKQTVKVRVEIGPGMPWEVKAFDEGGALEAVLAAFFQVMTAENLQPGPEGAVTTTNGGITARVVPTHVDVRANGDIPTTHVIECSGKVTLERRDDPGTDAVGD
jgi:hypothetical protein